VKNQYQQHRDCAQSVNIRTVFNRWFAFTGSRIRLRRRAQLIAWQFEQQTAQKLAGNRNGAIGHLSVLGYF
jgi:hypothetical protein